MSIMVACRRVGVSRRTIYNWIAAHKVEYVRTASGAVRIFSDTLFRDAGMQYAGGRTLNAPHQGPRSET